MGRGGEDDSLKNTQRYTHTHTRVSREIAWIKYRANQTLFPALQYSKCVSDMRFVCSVLTIDQPFVKILFRTSVANESFYIYIYSIYRAICMVKVIVSSADSVGNFYHFFFFFKRNFFVEIPYHLFNWINQHCSICDLQILVGWITLVDYPGN